MRARRSPQAVTPVSLAPALHSGSEHWARERRVGWAVRVPSCTPVVPTVRDVLHRMANTFAEMEPAIFHSSGPLLPPLLKDNLSPL